MKTEKIHISQVIIGDTVIHEGAMQTVSGTNIKYCSFMGKSLFGDCYHSGHKPVERVIFK